MRNKKKITILEAAINALVEQYYRQDVGVEPYKGNTLGVLRYRT